MSQVSERVFQSTNNIQSGCPHFLFLFYSVQLCWKQAEEVTKTGCGLERFLNFPFQHLSCCGAIQTGGHLTNSPLSELTACFLVRNVLLLNVALRNCWSLKVEVFDPQWSALVAVMSLVPQSEGRCLQEGGSVLRGRFLGLYKNIINKRLVLL